MTALTGRHIAELSVFASDKAVSNKIIIIVIVIKRQFIRRSNVARITTMAPYNVC